jgi:hypothetical protein
VRDAITGQNDLLEAQEIFENATAGSIFGRGHLEPRSAARSLRATGLRVPFARRRGATPFARLAFLRLFFRCF